MSDFDTAQTIISDYDNLKEKCYEYMRGDASTLGPFMWLYNAIFITDIHSLMALHGGIEVSGQTFTTQTQDLETFSFVVPYSHLFGR